MYHAQRRRNGLGRVADRQTNPFQTRINRQNAARKMVHDDSACMRKGKRGRRGHEAGEVRMVGVWLRFIWFWINRPASPTINPRISVNNAVVFKIGVVERAACKSNVRRWPG